MAERTNRTFKRNLAYLGSLVGTVGVGYLLATQGGKLTPEQMSNQVPLSGTATPTSDGGFVPDITPQQQIEPSQASPVTTAEPGEEPIVVTPESLIEEPAAAVEVSDDALKTPLKIAQEQLAELPSLSGVVTASSPDVGHPSEYMIGTTVVDIIFADKEAWTNPNDREIAEAQIRQALAWWENKSGGKAHFVVPPSHLEDTTVNPITLPSAQERQYIGEIFTNLGVPGSDHFQQWYNYDHQLRQKHGTDWATTFFIVNSSNTRTGKFPDGRASYMYVNGPGGVLDFNKDFSINGPLFTPTSSVAAHEIAHPFGADDQYRSANIDCKAEKGSGYKKAPPRNSETNNTGAPCTKEQSIMIGLSQMNVDSTLAAQVGLTDSTPGIGFESDLAGEVQTQFVISSEGNNAKVEGEVHITAPEPGSGNNAIRINWVARVSLFDPASGRIVPAIAKDGVFNSPDEDIVAEIPASANGKLQVLVEGHVGGISRTEIQGPISTVPVPNTPNSKRVYLPLVVR